LQFAKQSSAHIKKIYTFFSKCIYDLKRYENILIINCRMFYVKWLTTISDEAKAKKQRLIIMKKEKTTSRHCER
ncbi:MAG: hypothetical protein LBH30_07785, partial [Prevotellaceae bacterium]|jgi:hypothetical protein|nr:hypothetical protein [Prevotellaceae bacterium]